MFEAAIPVQTSFGRQKPRNGHGRGILIQRIPVPFLDSKRMAPQSHPLHAFSTALSLSSTPKSAAFRFGRMLVEHEVKSGVVCGLDHGPYVRAVEDLRPGDKPNPKNLTGVVLRNLPERPRPRKSTIRRTVVL